MAKSSQALFLRTNLKSNDLNPLSEVSALNKKVAYGAMATIVAIALMVAIGGALAPANAQSSNNEIYGQACIAPLGLKVGTWFKWGWGPSSRLIQVSSEYNQTVMDILKSNEEVLRLLEQGYSVISIRPIIRAYVEGDGTVVFKAQQALVVLSNGSTTVTYLVDISSGTVTHIATINISALRELGICRIRGARR